MEKFPVIEEGAVVERSGVAEEPGEVQKKKKESLFEVAVRSAENMMDEKERGRALFEVGKNMIGAGDFESAKELIGKIDEGGGQYFRFRLATEIALRSGDENDFELAMSEAEKLTGSTRELGFVEIAVWAARAKNEDMADKAAGKIADPGTRARVAAEEKKILETGSGTWTESYTSLEL